MNVVGVDPFPVEKADDHSLSGLHQKCEKCHTSMTIIQESPVLACANELLNFLFMDYDENSDINLPALVFRSRIREKLPAPLLIDTPICCMKYPELN
jgi:hypothetical protein